MPLGSRHEETGRLLRRGHELVLERDGGGTWRLDAAYGTHRLVGRRVKVTGIRDEFDLLAVGKVTLL